MYMPIDCFLCAHLCIDYRGRKRHVHRTGNTDPSRGVFTEGFEDHSDRRSHAASADYQVSVGKESSAGQVAVSKIR